MRVCLRTDADVIVKHSNGETIYRTQSMTLRMIQLWQTVFPNASFFYSKEDKVVCEQRLKNDQSDISTEIYPIEHEPDDSSVFVPIPHAFSKISMLTGYDVTDIDTADVASALHSVYLFQNQVYWLIFTFILLFIFLVVAAAVFTHRRELLWLDMMHLVEPGNYQPQRRQSRRNKITQQGYLRNLSILRVQLFLRNQSNSPRWLFILFTLLVFYLTTYFCSSYSTSSIVEKKPEILDTYKKLVNHANASVFFFNFILSASDSFEHAPADSLKEKIWARYLQTPASKDHMSTVAFAKISGYYKLMREEKYVMIGSTDFLGTVASAVCAFRGIDEIRHMHIMHDPSEHEQTFGFAVSSRFKNDTFIHMKLRRLAESAISTYMNHRYSEFMYEMAAQITGIQEGTMKQRIACTGSLKEDAQQLPAVPITYWITFFYASQAIFCLAFIILFLEFLFKPSGQRKRKRAKVAPVTDWVRVRPVKA